MTDMTDPVSDEALSHKDALFILAMIRQELNLPDSFPLTDLLGAVAKQRKALIKAGDAIERAHRFFEEQQAVRADLYNAKIVTKRGW